MLFWLLTISTLRLCIVQAEFDIVFEDIDCTNINEEYVKSCEFELNYDSTYGSSMDTYLEFVKPIPANTRVQVNLYTVRMGEYNVDVGLHLDTDFCQAVGGDNSVGIPMLRAVNMDSEHCPPQAGVYQREGYVIDNMDGLPTSFPSGHYLLNMTLSTEGTVIMHLDVYVRVY